MPAVEVSMGTESYKPIEVPDGCTVWRFKELLHEGFLDKPVAYVWKLKFSKELTGKVLQDEDSLPESPERMDVQGPSSVMGMLEIALRHKLGPPTLKAASVDETAIDTWDEVCRALGGHSVKGAFDFWGPADDERVQKLARRPDPDDPRPPPEDTKNRQYLQVGEEVAGYSVLRRLGEGFTGVVYLAGHEDAASTKVALKWPLRPSEVAAWRQIQRRAGIVPGLPLLLGSGDHAGQPYAMTELLGWDLSRALKPFKKHPLRRRWGAVKVIGRMVLRRLEALHRVGFVHCDVSPFNVLFGHARGLKQDGGLTLYLIDFGLAQAFPGGPPLGASDGTTEFNSVRTASGFPRLPEDDLESLGWILLWLLWAGLPWDDELESDHIAKACAAKRQLLTDGWSSFPGAWAKLAETPQDLRRFLVACRWQELAPVGPPDYALLRSLLGGRAGLQPREAEEEDAREWRVRVVPLL